MRGLRLSTRRVSATGALALGAGLFVATIGVAAQQPDSQTPPPAQPPASPAQTAAPAPTATPQSPTSPAPPATAGACVVTGTVTGLGGPLPGVSITARKGYAVQSATSTGQDGSFRLALPDATYQFTLDLTGFDRVQRDVTVAKSGTCNQVVDAALQLAPRTAAAGRGAGPAAGQPAPGAQAGSLVSLVRLHPARPHRQRPAAVARVDARAARAGSRRWLSTKTPTSRRSTPRPTSARPAPPRSSSKCCCHPASDQRRWLTPSRSPARRLAWIAASSTIVATRSTAASSRTMVVEAATLRAASVKQALPRSPD